MPKWLVLINVVLPIYLSGQSITLKGYITDGVSGLPLSNAEVYIGDSLATYADSTGVFIMVQLTAGRSKITFFKPGYWSYEIPDLLLENGQDLTLDIPLDPLRLSGDTILVAQNQTIEALNHFQKIGVEETDRYPATFFDPARLVQTFPGVATVNDQANHLIIRGQSPNLITWRIEGLEIVNPNHTSNAGTFTDEATLSGGGVNMISAQLLQNTQFYSGYAPANYAHGQAATMDLNLKPGNDQSWQSAFQLGVLGIDLSGEGPLVKDKVSMVANYRYSSLGLLSDLGVDIGEETIRFQDAALSVNIRIPKGALQLFGFWGASSNEFTGNPDTIATFKDLFSIDYKNDVGIAGFHFSKYSRQTVWNVGSAYSRLDGSRAQDWLGEPLNIRFPSRSNIVHEKISSDAHGSWSFSNRGYFKFGIQSLYERVGFWRQDTDNQFLDEFMIYPYAQFQSWIGPQTELSVGGRWLISDHYKSRFEPNFYINHNLATNHRLSLLVNAQAQLEHPATNIPSARQDKKPQMLMSSLVYLYMMKTAHLKTALFYHYGWNNYPASSQSIHPANWFSELSFGTFLGLPFGQNQQRGVELSYQKYLTESFFGLANLSFIDSEYRYSKDTEWQPSRWDQDWIANVSLGKEFSRFHKGKHRIFGINLRLTTFRGFREPVIDQPASDLDWTTVYRYSEGFTERLDPTFRLDLRLSWRRSKGQRSGLLSLDIQNVLNLDNPAYTYYDPYLNRNAIQSQLGIIPILSYKYYWNYR